MTQPPADPLVGTTVAQYEILARIGGGGMGVVYAARDTKLGRRVALKFLPPQWSHDEAARQRFVREAQAASATDHPNICTIHDIERTADGHLFIVMAHYDGQTLKQKLDEGALDIDTAVEIAAQVAEGLAKAHAQGVVHRDVKPGNLMICGESVKILDFGLATFANALQLTMEGSTLGTAAYMSPEQVKGEEADARSDVWSLGVVLYEMLAGRVPFHGTYAEAVSYAIRHETPAPLRSLRPEVPEALEQIVFRALHKEAAVRYQDARELARALRTLQGRVIPEDLLTQPLAPQHRTLPPAPRPASRWRRRAAIAAAVLLVAVAGAYPLIAWPVERIPIAIVPVANQTGYAELGAYRMALTAELTAALADASRVRVLPYERVLEAIEAYQAAGRDVSSRDAVQALTAHSGADTLVVPTLLHDGGAWKARVEFRSASTATTLAEFETQPVVSALMTDTIHRLMPAVASGIDDYFAENASRRELVVDYLRSAAGWAPAPRTAPRFATLDAARAFERGTNAYYRLEYGEALAAFSQAAAADTRSPLPSAWQSRVAWLMRQDSAAADAANRALELMTAETRPRDRLFIEAVAAEARRDVTAGDAAYRAMAEHEPRNPAPLLELAAFQDRRGRNDEAITSYHAALALDGRLVRADIDLCRLYNRINESANARTHGRRAVDAAQKLQASAMEAQALFCLSDAMRVGTEPERRLARGHAERALLLLQQGDAAYQLSRAHYYIGLAAAEQGDIVQGAASWEQAATIARDTGNTLLEPLLLMNLGAAHERLGNGLRAAAHYRESSAAYQKLGDELRAAQIQANGANLRIEFGDTSAAALRDLENALAVVRQLGDKDFEAFGLHVLGTYYRYAGRLADSERELTRALAVAAERDLDQKVAQISVELGRLRLDEGEFAAARDALMKARGDGSGRYGTQARIYLGRLHARTGDFAAGEAELRLALQAVEKVQAVGVLRPQLQAALGELALESGRRGDARAHFRQAMTLASGNPASETYLESRAYLGWLDAAEGRTSHGRAEMDAARAQAITAGKRALAARIALLIERQERAVRRTSGLERAGVFAFVSAGVYFDDEDFLQGG